MRIKMGWNVMDKRTGSAVVFLALSAGFYIKVKYL